MATLTGFIQEYDMQPHVESFGGSITDYRLTLRLNLSGIADLGALNRMIGRMVTISNEVEPLTVNINVDVDELRQQLKEVRQQLDKAEKTSEEKHIPLKDNNITNPIDDLEL